MRKNAIKDAVRTWQRRKTSLKENITKHQQRHDDKSMDRTRRALEPPFFSSRAGATLCTASCEAGAVRAQAPWDLGGRGRGGTEPHSWQAAKLRSVGGALGGLRSVAVHPIQHHNGSWSQTVGRSHKTKNRQTVMAWSGSTNVG